MCTVTSVVWGMQGGIGLGCWLGCGCWAFFRGLCPREFVNVAWLRPDGWICSLCPCICNPCPWFCSLGSAAPVLASLASAVPTPVLGVSVPESLDPQSLSLQATVPASNASNQPCGRNRNLCPRSSVPIVRRASSCLPATEFASPNRSVRLCKTGGVSARKTLACGLPARTDNTRSNRT